MLDFLFDKFFNSLDSTDQKDFEQWVEKVGEKISDIANELNDAKLIDTILNDRSFETEFFVDEDETLVGMYKSKLDIEAAAYRILNIMKKNKDKYDFN